MGLLSLKPKVSIEDCCRGFYDSQIFKAKTVIDTTIFEKETDITDIARIDIWSYYLARSKDLVAEDDQSLSGFSQAYIRQ